MKSIRNKRRLLGVLYLMAAYLVFQLVWWGWQLYRLQYAYLQHLKSEGSPLPENALRNKIFMIVGEGGVFLVLLFLGIWWIKKNVWQDLKRAQKEKNFLLAVTHELKTPIAAIRLNSQTLKNRELSKEQSKELCADIITESNRLETLVNNILLATQFEQNTSVGNWQSVNFSNVVENQVKRFQQLFPERHVNSSIQMNIEMNGEENMLVSLLFNLLENANKYSPNSEAISVSLKASEHVILLEVSDQGAGIPNEERKAVFEKFHRVGNEQTRSQKGTGLGLYIVKEICKAHRADINISDNTPRGTRFQITFSK
jgi:two-component system sensor histidine kinase CiaH